MIALREAVTVDDLLAQADHLDEDAVRRILDLLAELQAQVTQQIASRPDLTSSDLRALSAQIGALAEFYRQRLTATLHTAQADSWHWSQDAVHTQLEQAGIRVGIVGVSDTLLRTAQAISADQISGITDEARRKITREVQLAALGGRTLPQVLQAVGANLDSPSVFGSIAARAEAISRTEILRIQNLGYQAAGQQAASVLPGLQKTWQHRLPNMGARFQVGTHGAQSGLYRPRPAHMALHGTTIPWEQDFSVDGNLASGPHDPRLPASQTVNCACRLTLVPPESTN